MIDTHSHYVAAFTVAGPDGTQQAVCGSFVRPGLQARPDVAPTCWGCAMYVDNLDRIFPSAAPASAADTLERATA